MALGDLLTPRDGLFHSAGVPRSHLAGDELVVVPRAGGEPALPHMYTGFRTNLGVAFLLPSSCSARSRYGARTRSRCSTSTTGTRRSTCRCRRKPRPLSARERPRGPRMVEPLMRYSLRYDGHGDTHFELEYRALMPAVDSRETRTSAGHDFHPLPCRRSRAELVGGPHRPDADGDRRGGHQRACATRSPFRRTATTRGVRVPSGRTDAATSTGRATSPRTASSTCRRSTSARRKARSRTDTSSRGASSWASRPAFGRYQMDGAAGEPAVSSTSSRTSAGGRTGSWASRPRSPTCRRGRTSTTTPASCAGPRRARGRLRRVQVALGDHRDARFPARPSRALRHQHVAAMSAAPIAGARRARRRDHGRLLGHRARHCREGPARRRGGGDPGARRDAARGRP